MVHFDVKYKSAIPPAKSVEEQASLNWQKLLTFDTSPAQSPDTFSSYHLYKRCDHYVIFRNTCGGLILKRIGRQHVVSIDFITGAQPSVYGRSPQFMAAF